MRREPPVLAIEGLHLVYRSGEREVQALTGASLEVSAGEAVGLVGESGCGKSTLARVAMGLVPPEQVRITSGRILVNQRDVTRLEQRGWERLRGKPVAIVFQDPLSFLNPVMRIERQVAEGVRLHDPGADPKKRVRELLQLVHLKAEIASLFPHELSGGMRQRVLLAIALSCRPTVLIADEPTTALDVTTQAEILKLLAEIRAELGMGLLLISHDLAVVAAISDRVYVMYAGRTVESGPTATVLSSPAHPYTYALMRAAEAVRSSDGRFSTITGEPPRLDQTLVGCPFAERCPYRQARCTQSAPPAYSPARGQIALCWLLEGSAELAG